MKASALRLLGAALFLHAGACVGADGVRGEPGAKGDPGTPGSAGSVGAVGSVGPPGADGAPGVPSGTSGSRIKAKIRTMTFADGAKGATVVGWWDETKKVACVPRLASDGKTRCLPDVPTARPAVETTDGLAYLPDAYLDAACTIGAFRFVDSSCGTPALVARPNTDRACGAAWRAYTVTKQPDPVSVYVRLLSGTCIKSPGDPVKDVYAGPEVSPTEFVEVTETVTP